MGSIDLDPASSDRANEIVRASRYYTKEDSGLSHKWSGNVWLNPPFNRGLIEQFINMFLYSLESGYILQGIVLVNNSTETRWCQRLLGRSNALCFLNRRLKFYDEDLEELDGSLLQGQIIFGFNIEETGKFELEYGRFGICKTKSKRRKV